MGAMLNETEGQVGSDSSHESEDVLSVAPDGIEVRRHAGVAAGVGLTASAVAIAYLGRATSRTRSSASPSWPARPASTWCSPPSGPRSTWSPA